MQKFVLLYTSAEIHTRIKHIFGQPSSADKRVALVAYVGTDGEKYLPHPEGLRLICNPSAGGTDPDTLRSLLKRKATVEISDRLHMKVYWSKNRGCVITSANASSNALGKDGLKEVGIWLPSGTVDIKRLIRYADPREMRDTDWRRMDLESRQHKKNCSTRSGGKKPAIDFLQWYSSPCPPRWKIAWADEERIGSPATAVKEQMQSEYGHKEPHKFVFCEKSRVRKNDCLLGFTFTEHGVKSIYWLHVDFVVKVNANEKRYYSAEYPYHAVQANSPSKYSMVPFQITPRFRKAFCAAVSRYTPDKIREAKTDVPSVRFLKLIEQEYRRNRQVVV